MKQVLTKKQDFNSLSDEDKFFELQMTELTVKRLERIIEVIVSFRGGTRYYKQAIEDYERYCEEQN